MEIVIIPQKSYKEKPWKNGQGVTFEIACKPIVGTENFIWRLSMANVTSSGPFSNFINVDRTIVQLEGDPITLFHEDESEPVRLQIYTPYAFDGESSTRAEVLGPGKDFNIMVDRSFAESSVTSHTIAAQKYQFVNNDHDELFIFCLSGQVNIDEKMIEQYDSLWVSAKTETLKVQAVEDARFLVVKISEKST